MKSIYDVRRENLAFAMEALDYSQTALAQKMGIDNPSIVNQHIRGTKNIGEKFARRYEKALGTVSYSLDLDKDQPYGAPGAINRQPTLGPPGDYDHANRPPISLFRVTPQLDGKGSWVLRSTGESGGLPIYVSYLDAMGIPIEDASSMLMPDEAMRPRIEPGDAMVLDTNRAPIVSGGVYLVAVAGETCVRRIFRTPQGGVRLSADNPDRARFPEWNIELESMKNLQIIARIRSITGEV
ncbi:LexA family transcriptional regulator [Burkholderia gladioli]|uniref:LexA family transcriptional regulator n=1 Tax=Burkholderia gladioli TaxID=28095 RepID=UPI00163EBDD5|nr:LexA family transcriptional regulator [Burkholderia gladioli]